MIIETSALLSTLGTILGTAVLIFLVVQGFSLTSRSGSNKGDNSNSKSKEQKENKQTEVTK